MCARVPALGLSPFACLLISMLQLPVVLMSSDAGVGRFDKFSGPQTRAGVVQQLNKVTAERPAALKRASLFATVLRWSSHQSSSHLRSPQVAAARLQDKRRGASGPGAGKSGAPRSSAPSGGSGSGKVVQVVMHARPMTFPHILRQYV
jgi:hypothetical protein